ncbi:MAG TPA: GNAT family N-acetyltransferase [Acidobacteriaceae bacterium]|jgi:GNAT superfamily N-acetyltransferase
MPSAKPKFEFVPATADRWADVETLFGARGACGGCWCMTWRLPRAEFNRNKGEANRKALRALTRKDPAPGVLAYTDGKPIGWCAVAPREAYPALERSRILQPVDSQRVWSISCLFVEKSHRRQGLSAKLIQAATKFAKSQGAKIVEGYPQVVEGSLPAPFVWTGLEQSFVNAGFVEVARRTPKRPILRSKS